MKRINTKSEVALMSLWATLAVVVMCLLVLFIWQFDLFTRVYFSDIKTFLLNGGIFFIFSWGMIHLLRAYRHYVFEESQVTLFVSNRLNERGGTSTNLSPSSNIMKRYQTIRELHHKQVPINHGAISSIMVARESLHHSFPKFVNNILILTGVFGTVFSLILALVGAGSILESAVPGDGMNLMLLGMNTALTTTATAIACFLFFTFFYQKLLDIQTYVLGRIEEAVALYIIPEFAFDADAVNYKTERLIHELRGLVKEMESGVDYFQNTLAGSDQYQKLQAEKLEAILSSQDTHLVKTDHLLVKLDRIRQVLVNGFRLENQDDPPQPEN